MVQVSVKDCSYVKLEEKKKKNLVFTKEKKKKNLSVSQITETVAINVQLVLVLVFFPLK